MPRFRSRRPSFGRRVRMARPIVRAITGISLVKRILAHDLTIPDISAADFDNPLNVTLLECTEAQDEQAISDGTVVADAPLYSKIKGFRLQGVARASTASLMRWVLYKSPDGDLTASTLVNGSEYFHGSNDTPTAREMRKHTLAKGMLYMNASNQAVNFRVFVSRKALARVSPLKENDTIKFAIAKDAAGTTIPLDLMGQFYIKANG